VLLTHYHADHTNGVAGYVTADERPVVLATATTRDLVLQKNQPPDEARSAVLAAATMLSTSEPTTLDLGGRSVRIIPRAGHTASDVWLEVADAGVVFCGDLVWNAMFPNYVDALPTQLAASVRALRRDSDTLYVPGHGAPGRTAEFDRYVAMLDEVERAARKAHAAGVSPADAAAAFTLPPSLGEWTLLGRTFFERAFAAWYRELP
jgi:glyoxylase-like metal-dependent hydrolase (beta-lactamase superfamily II)